MKLQIAVIAIISGLAAIASTTLPESAPAAFPISGTVEKAMDSGGYTYLLVRSGQAATWVATSPTRVETGDNVVIQDGMVMNDFHSTSLDRTFASIVFAGSIDAGGAHGSPAAAGGLPPGHPPIDSKDPHGGRYGHPSREGQSDALTGEVIETMNAGGYTYVNVRAGDITQWAASGQTDVTVGDTVTLTPGMNMKNFESPTLGKTFASIWFVDAIAKTTSQEAATPGHSSGSPDARTDDISRPEGTLSVLDVHTRRKELAGTIVSVHGKVTKVNERIMGHNWIHLDDGTGTERELDITITSQQTAKVGDILTATGTVAVDEDFGYTYQYPVMIKDAALRP